jgi:hypothetical protein
MQIVHKVESKPGKIVRIRHNVKKSHKLTPSSLGARSVLPTGRYFGRKTQYWPNKNLSGRKNMRPNFSQICLKVAEKWQNFFEVCSLLKSLNNLKA